LVWVELNLIFLVLVDYSKSKEIVGNRNGRNLLGFLVESKISIKALGYFGEEIVLDKFTKGSEREWKAVCCEM
jgi:hypothetical protein